jgi:hypothetical protein
MGITERYKDIPQKKQLYIMLALLIVLPCILYYRSLKYAFLYELDDDWIILSNDSIKVMSHYGIKNGLRYLFLYDHTDFHYHPVTYLSLSIDYLLFGLNVTAIKLHNLFLHITAGILLFAFINRIIKNRWIGFFIALVFLIHPMNIDSVAWPSCRRQALFFTYFLACALVYKIFLEKRHAKHSIWLYVLSLVLWTLSMLAKASAIVMPGIFVLIYIHENRNDIRLKTILKHLLPTIPILFVIILLNEDANARNYLVRNFSYSNFEHLMFTGYTYLFYWIKGVFPFPLVVFYPSPPENLPLPWHYYIMFAGSFILIMVMFYHFFKKQSNLFFALGFYTLCVLPTLNLIYFPLGDLPMLVSNRYFYHSGIGIILYIVLLIHNSLSNYRLKQILASTYLVLLIILFRIYLPVWKNQETMYENNARYYPSEVTLYQLALIYEKEGKTKKAIACLDKADKLGTNIWINSAWPYYQERSRLYLKAGKYDKALADINTAIRKSYGKKPDTDSLLHIDKLKIMEAMH